MAPPDDSAQPRMAPGCRWTQSSGEFGMVLFPEGALRVRDTGREILERCDGVRTVAQIVEELQARYNATEPSRIKEEVIAFLDQLRQKRILDF